MPDRSVVGGGYASGRRSFVIICPPPKEPRSALGLNIEGGGRSPDLRALSSSPSRGKSPVAFMSALHRLQLRGQCRTWRYPRHTDFPVMSSRTPSPSWMLGEPLRQVKRYIKISLYYGGWRCGLRSGAVPPLQEAAASTIAPWKFERRRFRRFDA